MSIIADAEGKDAASRGGVRRGSAAVEGCAVLGRAGVPGSAVPANSIRMTIFSGRCGLSDGGLNSFMGNFARQSPSPWPTGGLFTPRDKPDCPVIDRRSWKAINQIN